MPELSLEDLPAIRPLFHSLEKTHALAQAATVGGLPVRVFVDDAASPSCGVMVYKSRILCCGAGVKHELAGELAEWFESGLIPAHLRAGHDAFLVCFSDPQWENVLKDVFKPYKLFNGQRQYYGIRDFQSIASPSMPAGYSIQAVTQEFLSSGLTGMETLRDEMCSERLSADDFLKHSFGLCPVHDGEIAGWCLSEYNVENRCEIGIATLEKHQGKGIATLTTRFFLSEANSRGYTQVGWDCWKNNVASGATARKAGLTLVEEYPAMVVVLERDASQQ